MEETDIKHLQEGLRKIEKTQQKKFTIYTLVMVALGLSIGIWSVMEGNRALSLKKQSEQSQQIIDSLEKKIQRANDLLVSQREKIINNHSINGHLRLGLDYFYSKQFDLAIEEYDKAIALDSENFVLYDLKGYSQLKSKKIGEAVQSLEKSIELNPNYTWGHYNLSLAYWAAGRKTEAKNEIDKLIKLDPGFKKTILKDRQFSELISASELR